MTNPNLSLIAVVLDRSASMQSIARDTVGSLNTFLAEQRKLPGDARVTLALFNDEYQLVYNDRPIKDVAELSQHDYRPNGNTALYDAVGKTIDDIGHKLSTRSEDQRPGRVLVMILTDGHENASRQFSAMRIREMIQHQRDTYRWEFVFLGADVTAQAVAVDMGIDQSKAMAYSATNDGMHRVMRSASLLASNYRNAVDDDAANAVAFSTQDRVDNAPSAAAAAP